MDFKYDDGSFSFNKNMNQKKEEIKQIKNAIKEQNYF